MVMVVVVFWRGRKKVCEMRRDNETAMRRLIIAGFVHETCRLSSSGGKHRRPVLRVERGTAGLVGLLMEEMGEFCGAREGEAGTIGRQAGR